MMGSLRTSGRYASFFQGSLAIWLGEGVVVLDVASFVEVLPDEACSEPENIDGNESSPPSDSSSLLTGKRVPRKWDAMSPLRYPGSKRKMLPAIQQLIDANIPKPELFVEPFCGGSSVALGLLESDAVKRVMLADLDPLIAAFWLEATTNAERLIDDMMLEPITVDRWDYWRSSEPQLPRYRALKCLFLNRTTFSGIIGGSAGPIGGRAQTSEYTIGCRFDKEAIARRIRTIKQLADDKHIVGVFESTWQEALRHADRFSTRHLKSATVLYLDPPYIEKASRLYSLPFAEKHHRELSHFLTAETEHRWILSYDKEPLVIDLYRGQQGVKEYSVVHHYTMRGSRNSPVPGREVLFTNLPTDPTDLTAMNGYESRQ
jgi:DNA adenine methylase